MIDTRSFKNDKIYEYVLYIYYIIFIYIYIYMYVYIYISSSFQERWRVSTCPMSFHPEVWLFQSGWRLCGCGWQGRRCTRVAWWSTVLQMAEPSPYFLKPVSLPEPSLGFGRSIWFRNCWITLSHRQWHDSGDMFADFFQVLGNSQHLRRRHVVIP